MLIILTQFSRLTQEREGNKWLAISSRSVGVQFLQLKVKDIQGNYAMGPHAAWHALVALIKAKKKKENSN